MKSLTITNITQKLVSTLNLLRIDKAPIGNTNHSESPVTDNTNVNTINIERTNKNKTQKKKPQTED